MSVILNLYIEPDEEREPDDPHRWIDEQTESEYDDPPTPEKVLTVSNFSDIAALSAHLTNLVGKRLRYEVVEDMAGWPPRWPEDRKTLQLGATGTFKLLGSPPYFDRVIHERRPTRTAARKAIREFLSETWPEMNDERVRLTEDGDHDSARNKCGWAWWIFDDDTSSYVKEDLTIEWLGHSPPESEEE